MQKKSHYQSWLHFAKTWGKLITPPAKPCRSQLKIYDDIFKKTIKIKKANVLILGATPELRDICLKNGFKVTVCDINRDMVKAMTTLMKFSGRKQETVIIKNWLKLDFPANTFDIVMGDLSLNQLLKVSELKLLLKKVGKILKPSGLLITRESIRHSLTPLIKEDGWDKLYKAYKNKKLNLIDFYFFSKYQSDANSFRKSPGLVDFLPVFEKLDRLLEEHRIEKKFINKMEKAVSRKSKLMLVYTKTDLLKLLGNYFILLPIKQCHDHRHCRYMPMILGRPKK